MDDTPWILIVLFMTALLVTLLLVLLGQIDKVRTVEIIIPAETTTTVCQPDDPSVSYDDWRTCD